MLDDARPYAGQTTAQRQSDRRGRLREACLDLVGSQGLAGASLNGICAAAGLTKRYFYESFEGREQLLAELLQEFFLDVQRQATPLLSAQGQAWGPRLHVVVDGLLTTIEADPRRGRLYAEANSEPGLARVRELAIRGWVTFMLERIAPANRQSAECALYVLVSGTAELLCAWLLEPAGGSTRTAVLEGAVTAATAMIEALTLPP